MPEIQAIFICLFLNQGTVQEILVEEESKEKGIYTGRTEYNLLVHFPGCRDLLGKYVKAVSKSHLSTTSSVSRKSSSV